MPTPSAGQGVWFSEVQRDGSSKIVPGIVLYVADSQLVVVVARGTSQTGDRFCSDEAALEITPSQPSGQRLNLKYVTRFRADDVKVIEVDSIIGDPLARMTRDVWKQLVALTRDAVERRRAELQPE